ncbi:MAG: ABC transporter substrate-binding protein [Microbacteriaceae bacterium]
MIRTRYALPVFLAAAAMTLTGCVNNEASAPQDTGNASASTTKDEAIAKLLPEKIRSSGKLVVGTDAAYPPNEYKDADGKPIGWDIELADALGAKLGLTVSYQVAKFDNIIPSITGGKVNIGVSSFTDNAEREKQVDFINYYTAGILWASPTGKTVDPDNACGLTIAVQSTTVEDTDEVPAKSKACTDAGKAPINKLKFDAQDQATTAVVLGQADAMSADSPVTAYAIKKADGKLQAAGESFDNTPYGMPVAKDSKLQKPIQKAMQALIDDGTYGKILKKWGVEAGAVEKVEINAGSKG